MIKYSFRQIRHYRKVRSHMIGISILFNAYYKHPWFRLVSRSIRQHPDQLRQQVQGPDSDSQSSPGVVLEKAGHRMARMSQDVSRERFGDMQLCKQLDDLYGRRLLERSKVWLAEWETLLPRPSLKGSAVSANLVNLPPTVKGRQGCCKIEGGWGRLKCMLIVICRSA